MEHCSLDRRPSGGRGRSLWPILLILPLFTPQSLEAACKQTGARPVVHVKAKTAVRRGPGLNYAPSALLETAQCLTASESTKDGLWVLVEEEKGSIYGWVPATAIDSDDQTLIPGEGRTGEPPPKKGAPKSEPQQAPPATAKPAPPKSDPKNPTPTPKKEPPKKDPPKKEPPAPEPPRVEPKEKPAPVRAPSAPAHPPSAPAHPPSAPIEPPAPKPDEDERDPEEAQSSEGSAEDARDSGGHITTSLAKGFGDTSLRLDVLFVGALPHTRFDSNGGPGSTRYEIAARGAGGRVALEAGPMFGRFNARLAYNFIFMSGLKPPGAERGIEGQVHDLQLVAGYAFDLGPVQLNPEVGYVLSRHATETGLPGAEVAQFISDTTHAATLGGSAAIGLLERVELVAELSLILGKTSPQYGLGSSGFTTGVRTGLSGRYVWTEALSLIARWDLRQRHAGYSGPAEFERSITEASLSHLDNTFAIGAGYRF